MKPLPHSVFGMFKAQPYLFLYSKDKMEWKLFPLQTYRQLWIEIESLIYPLMSWHDMTHTRGWRCKEISSLVYYGRVIHWSSLYIRSHIYSKLVKNNQRNEDRIICPPVSSNTRFLDNRRQNRWIRIFYRFYCNLLSYSLHYKHSLFKHLQIQTL